MRYPQQRPRKIALGQAATLPLTIAVFVSVVAMQPARAQSYQVIYEFNGNSGYNPPAGMIFDSAGNLYGTTSAGGGAIDFGTAFELSRSGSGWALSTLHAFDWNPNQQFSDGADPHAPLVFGPDGSLYGTTGSGGLPASGGTVFELTPSGDTWTETILYRFTGGADGGEPASAVTFNQSGNLYGTTSNGGKLRDGTVYELSPVNGGWRETVIWNFGVFTSDGETPFSNVILQQGNLYGTTVFGGTGNGTVFELVPAATTWREKVLYRFTGGNDGGNPIAGLIPDHAGNMWGATSSGGSGGGGTIFELTPSGSGWEFHLIYSLSGYGGQGGPFANLAFDQAGNLYGTTYADGANHVGTVFKLTNSNGNWVYTDLHDFDGTDGEYPESSLTFDASGTLYGTTNAGGTGTGCNATCGVAFEITPQ